MFKKIAIVMTLATLFVATFLFRNPLAREKTGASIDSLPGLQRPVTVVRDKIGVPHLTGSSDHDVYFMMGFVQAQDRFFQMDVARRQGSGKMAELLGAGPDDQFLGSDIQIRTLGVRRSAERSLSAYSRESMALLQAYSDGVNAWLNGNPLPPEYAPLEITQVPRWTPLDSLTVIKLIQLQLSFDTEDLRNTQFLFSYQAAGQAGGFDGTSLFFEDLFRCAPFDPAVTVPHPAGGAAMASRQVQSRMVDQALQVRGTISPELLETAGKMVKRFEQNPLLNRAGLGIGSNWWVVAGSKTDSGNVLLANDPHLALGTPSTFYEIHLTVDSQSSPMNVYGVSFPGVPGVFLGQNDRISWGATTAGMDLTDFYAERLVVENGAPVATIYQNQIEPLVIIPEEFKVNQVQNGVADDLIVISPGQRPSDFIVPPATLIVPRRNNGPVIIGTPVDAISIQVAGASATRELEGIFALSRARNLTDFKRGLEFFETAPLNWAYADVNGNIASYVSGKVPLREDLNAGFIDGLPPFFLRDGTGAARNEWVPRSDPGPGFNFESLPFEEMPQSVNPPQGFLVNANNDPIGVTLDNNPLNQMRQEGLYYLSFRFNPGFRAGKINSLLNERLRRFGGHGKVSFQDMQRIQSNVQLLDAEVFVPYLTAAFVAARRTGAPAELAALANDPGVREAVGRLSGWDFSTPTGILAGYDAGDLNGVRQWPSNREVSNSVAATIYTVWRRQFLLNTIMATLQRVGLAEARPNIDWMLADLRVLLENFPTNHGIGASGLDFFEIPGVEAPPEIRRDGLILNSLKEALTLLASDAYAAAFGGSTNQNDYRWGKLHRITFSHIFGSLAPQFSVPTAGNFVNLSPTLPGLATDGGLETIDNAAFDGISASSQSQMFRGGPARRYVGELNCRGIKSLQVIPGGESGVINNQFYTNQLSLWLTNDYHPVLSTSFEIERNQYSKIVYKPAS